MENPVSERQEFQAEESREQEAARTMPFRHALAHWVSIIVHPIAFPLFTLGVITYADGIGASQQIRLLAAGRLVLVSLALTSLPITLLVSYQVLRGRWTDLDVSVRRQRYALYPFGIACMLLLAFVFARLNAPRIAIGAAIAIVLANAADGLINFMYKVSAHATGAAVCASLLWVAVPPSRIPAALAALAVGWSRVVLGRHTRGQVALGWAVGVAASAVALALGSPGGV